MRQDQQGPDAGMGRQPVTAPYSAHFGAFPAGSQQLVCLPPKIGAPLPRPHMACAQVAVGRDGSVFVADGYCNSRVVRYSAAGQYISEYRLPEAQGRLNVPHALALHECKGRLLVADRESAAVHAFEVGSGELRGE
jgi:hypothetical protein